MTVLIDNGVRPVWYVNPSKREEKAIRSRVPWSTRYSKHPVVLIFAGLLSLAMSSSVAVPPLVNHISAVVFVCIVVWTIILITRDILYLRMYRRMKRQHRIITFGTWDLGFTLFHGVLFSEEAGRGLEYGHWRDVIVHADSTWIDLFLMDPKNRRLLRDVGWGMPEGDILHELERRAANILADIEPYSEAVRQTQRRKRLEELEVAKERRVNRVARDTDRLRQIERKTAELSQ